MALIRLYQESLKTAIRDTHAVGGHSVLLVVGKGEDGPEQEIWKRSIENISMAVPLAAQLGVQIAAELKRIAGEMDSVFGLV